MRLIPILTAIIVIAAVYLLVFERDRVLDFSRGETAAEMTTGTDQAAVDSAQEGSTSEAVDRVSVIALTSVAQQIDSAVLLRGRTEALRQVQLKAETSGQVVSEPLRKGAFVTEGELLCRLDPGTRQVGLAEAKARQAEALSRVPESEARVAEAQSRVPATQAALAEAEARVPAAEAALAEAKSRVPAVKASLAEANARLAEATINHNAATRLSEGGFASETRVANAAAALESARAGVQSVNSQVEGAAAAVISAEAAVEGARAAVQSVKSQIDGAFAGVQSAQSQVENAKAGVQSAQAGVAAAEKEIDRLTITAPFSGHLESDTAELGTLLQPGALCATIVQLDPIKLIGFVPEIDVDRVELGVPAGARLTSGREVIGVVTFLSRAADPTTRTFRVEVEVANDDLSIRDGQTAEILISSDGRMAHLLPQSSLTLDDDGTLGVRVVGDGDMARFRPVEMIRDTVQGVWVAGLDETVDVIVVGQEYVSDGVALAVTYREPDA